ncbi:hypothetical protein CYMTET_34813, partial [Cymbomonas tetramitiformis]
MQTENEKLKRENKKLQEQYRQLHKELEALKKQMASDKLRSDGEIERLKEMLELLKGKLEILGNEKFTMERQIERDKHRVDAYQPHLNEIEQLKAELAELRASEERLRNQFADVLKQLEEAALARKELQERLERQKAAAASANSNVCTLSRAPAGPRTAFVHSMLLLVLLHCFRRLL